MDSVLNVTNNDIRKVATFIFDNGKTAFYDFCNEQYFNYLRTRHMIVQGVHGEICDTIVNYLSTDGTPVSLEYKRVDTGVYSNLEGYYHRGIMLGDRFAFISPFADKTSVRLNDDEIATATCMIKMKKYVDSAKDFIHYLRLYKIHIWHS